MLYPELQMPYMSILEPQKTLLRIATEKAVEDQFESQEEVELAMVLAMQEAEKKAKRTEQRVARRKKRRARMCSTSWRLPLWFKKVTMLLCLAYCAVMALITMIYGIKFTLRGSELERQRDLAQWSDINVTYFNNDSSNMTMLKFQVNGSIALERGFVTEVELANRNLYANDTVEIVRPVMEEVYGPLESVYGKVLNNKEFLILSKST
jgi:hypothetical protein